MESKIKPISSISPYVLEERQLNVTQLDVFSRLMKDRIIFLGTDINDDVANIIQAQLLFLDSVSNEPIQLYINSYGGSVFAGLGIYDTMNLIKSPVNTICTGIAASMAAILLANGNKRYALKNAYMMLHQPLGGTVGQAVEVEIYSKHLTKIKNKLYELLSKDTNKTLEQIEKDCDRDFWLDAEQALDYGLIDKLL